jgi:hypothetical protein
MGPSCENALMVQCGGKRNDQLVVVVAKMNVLDFAAAC